MRITPDFEAGAAAADAAGKGQKLTGSAPKRMSEQSGGQSLARSMSISSLIRISFRGHPINNNNKKKALVTRRRDTTDARTAS